MTEAQRRAITWGLRLFGLALMVTVWIFGDYSWFPRSLTVEKTYQVGPALGFACIAAAFFYATQWSNWQARSNTILTASGNRYNYNANDKPDTHGNLKIQVIGGINSPPFNFGGDDGLFIAPARAWVRKGPHAFVDGHDVRMKLEDLPPSLRNFIEKERLPTGRIVCVWAAAETETKRVDFTEELRQFILANREMNAAESINMNTIMAFESANNSLRAQISKPSGVVSKVRQWIDGKSDDERSAYAPDERRGG